MGVAEGGVRVGLILLQVGLGYFINRLMKSLFLVLLLSASATLAGPIRFYLGTYTDKAGSKGIYTGTIDADSGSLGPLELAAVAASPSFLALSPDGKTMYACTSPNGGSVAAFQVTADGRQLVRLNERPSGSGGCHVSVDASGGTVMVANYGGGSVCSFPTQPDGSLGAMASIFKATGSGPDAQRQTKPYLHSIYAGPGNRRAYACDLGSDSVWIFDLAKATGALTPANPTVAKVPPGSGPRHLAWHPNGRFAYVNGEMGLNVTAFELDAASGALTAIQTLPTLPPDASRSGVTTAEIFCHPSGKWLYVSNRGADTIEAYAIGADGKLTWLQDCPAGVKVPRGFGLDRAGRWLITAGQNDNRIAVLKIDPASGRLSATGQGAAVGAPVCVLFAP